MLTSSSDENVSFAVVLDTALTYETLNDSSDEWLQFLQDHRPFLIVNSRPLAMNEQSFHAVHYRIRKFLQENNYGSDLELAFRVVNNIHLDTEFIPREVPAVLIPDRQYLINLRTRFRTHQKKLAAL